MTPPLAPSRPSSRPPPALPLAGDTTTATTTTTTTTSTTPSRFAIPEAAMSRLAAMMLILFASAAIYLWAQMEVRNAAVSLDKARSQLKSEEIVQERLTMERAMLRQPVRMEAAAKVLGLVQPTAVHQVRDLLVEPGR